MYQVLFWVLGICHRTRPPSLLGELPSSGRWKGSDIQELLHSCSGCFVSLGNEAVGMFAPRRQQSSGLGQFYAP